MWRYCKSAGIKMSRSRPYKKNDNAWVEQRNWTTRFQLLRRHVRKVVGYRRMDSQAELDVLRELYPKVCLYKNFFQPTLKLMEKIREGGKIHRKYEKPRTPYERVMALSTLAPMESDQIPERSKKRLKQQYESMNVAELHRQIEVIRNRLFDLIEGKAQVEPPKPKRRGPSITVKSRATADWMQKMIGKKEQN